MKTKGKNIFLNFLRFALAFTTTALFSLLQPGAVSAYFEYGTYDHSSGNLDYVNKSFYMEMTAPYNVKITSLRIYNNQMNSGDDFRFAIYAGGTEGNPAGSTLIYESPVLSHAGNGMEEFPLGTTVSIDENTLFGVAIKWAGKSLRQNFTNKYTALGDCSEHYYNIDDTAFTAFNPTMGTAQPIPLENGFYAYTNFSLLLATYPVIDSVTPDTNLDDNQTGIHVSGTGLRYLDGGIWLTENNDWNNPGIKVLQHLEPFPNDTDVYFTTVFENLQGPTVYLWLETLDSNDAAEGRPSEVNDVGYPLAVNAFDTTAPLFVPASLEVTPDDGAFTAGTFTLSAEFDDAESRVYRCEYSTNGGGSWLEGTVSGTASPYTCSAEISLSNGSSVDLTFRASSGGGMDQATESLLRTIDAVGPVEQASATTLSTDGICTISWTQAADAGSGMHGTEPYEIRQQSNASSTGCTNGTQVYLGTDTNFDHLGLINGDTKYYTICYKDSFGQLTESANLACAMPDVVIGDGTNPPGGWVQQDSEVLVSTFTLATYNNNTPANNYTDTVTDIDMIFEPWFMFYEPGAIEFVKIYEDNGSVSNALDDGDTLIASSNTREVVYTGSEWHFTGLSIPVSPITVSYLIVLDMRPTVRDGDEFRMRIVRALSQKTSSFVTSLDSYDALLISDSTAPSSWGNILQGASEWQNYEVPVSIYPNDYTADYAGSEVDPATGIFGCFGTGCTPVLLGSDTMTTSCGAGNSCVYDAISYYSIDRAGNIETIKTRSDEPIKIDRVPPITGTLTATGMTNPIQLTWQGFSDIGSGLTQYQTFILRRSDGPTPPADCSSGALRYIGQSTATSYADSGTDGQQYSYRLCVTDGAGNTSSVTATATAETCITETQCGSCHTLPAGGAHMFHGMPCTECHQTQLNPGINNDPSHTDGMIRLRPEITTYSGGDQIPYPGNSGTPYTFTCGGFNGPIGGALNSQPPQMPPLTLPCHWGATWGGPAPMDNPDTTPYWECIWDGSGTCNDVGAGADYNDCNSCHGIPVGSGMTGGSYFAGAHEIHMSRDCIACHQETGPDPGHLNGMVNLTPNTAWNGPNPQPWPGAGPATCGGSGQYIGDPTDGGMACHNGTQNPILTSDWECVWDIMPYCIDPTMP
ncbi:MAG: hypothetical protein KQH63_20220 [Desulfobulbaceae bacterium]|nr:hypothetical protein [Desulfobulbaceae bacterium]